MGATPKVIPLTAVLTPTTSSVVMAMPTLPTSTVASGSLRPLHPPAALRMDVSNAVMDPSLGVMSIVVTLGSILFRKGSLCPDAMDLQMLKERVGPIPIEVDLMLAVHIALLVLPQCEVFGIYLLANNTADRNILQMYAEKFNENRTKWYLPEYVGRGA